jgi:hypothetical protein
MFVSFAVCILRQRATDEMISRLKNFKASATDPWDPNDTANPDPRSFRNTDCFPACCDPADFL